MAKKKLKPFSVVGIYADNQQPWVTHVNATTAEEAAEKGIKKTYNGGENGVEELNIFVVDVFKGHIRGQLTNDKTFNLKELEEEGI